MQIGFVSPITLDYSTKAGTHLVEEGLEAVVPDLPRQLLYLHSHPAELAAGGNKKYFNGFKQIQVA